GGLGARGAGGGLAREQPGGGREQRGADAPGASEAPDARAARPEAPALEPAPVPRRGAEGEQPVSSAGAGLTPGQLVGPAQAITGTTTPRTVRPKPGCLR